VLQAPQSLLLPTLKPVLHLYTQRVCVREREKEKERKRERARARERERERERIREKEGGEKSDWEEI
jgi:hypothetical protein